MLTRFRVINNDPPQKKTPASDDHEGGTTPHIASMWILFTIVLLVRRCKMHLLESCSIHRTCCFKRATSGLGTEGKVLKDLEKNPQTSPNWLQVSWYYSLCQPGKYFSWLNGTSTENHVGVEPQMGVPPVIIHLKSGFSRTKTIHFGVPPFVETPISGWRFGIWNINFIFPEILGC